jgi:hypothetical protein
MGTALVSYKLVIYPSFPHRTDLRVAISQPNRSRSDQKFRSTEALSGTLPLVAPLWFQTFFTFFFDYTRKGFCFWAKFQSLFAAPCRQQHDRGQNRAKIAPVGKIPGLRLCFVEWFSFSILSPFQFFKHSNFSRWEKMKIPRLWVDDFNLFYRTPLASLIF